MYKLDSWKEDMYTMREEKKSEVRGISVPKTFTTDGYRSSHP